MSTCILLCFVLVIIYEKHVMWASENFKKSELEDNKKEADLE